MTSRSRRQLIALAALAMVLVVVLVVQRGGGSPAGSPAAPSNPAGRTAAPGAGEQGVTDVKLELLEGERVKLDAADRNPFRFEAKAPPPPPRPVAPPPRDFSVAPPVVSSGPPPPPPIPVRYIGFAETAEGDNKVAWFADGRGNQFQGREGDTLEGRYKILRIGPDSVELAYLDGRGRQTIRLQGQ